MKELLEKVKDLNLYKTLVITLGKYSTEYPMTGVDNMFNALAEKGKKCIPSDDKAQDILACVLTTDESIPGKVQKLLNCRFASLDLCKRPVYKTEDRMETAFWSIDGKISDKVVGLVDFEGGNAKRGFWCDQDGKKVTIISFE